MEEPKSTTGHQAEQDEETRLRYECEQALLRMRFSQPSIEEEWERQEARAQENENRELHIIEIIRKAGELCSKNFKNSNEYTLLYKKINSDKESLSYEEQKKFQTIILKEFDTYLQQLSSIIPLTDNDAFLCALLQLGFSTKECAACRGISSETIRSQRTRIKKKIPQNFLDRGLAVVILGDENLSKR